MTRLVLAIGLTWIVLLASPVLAYQEVDGADQRRQAERILDEPRFGETRPGLWDRFADWFDDWFSEEPSPTEGGTGGSGADGSTGGSGGDGTGSRGTDELATPEDGPTPISPDGSPADPGPDAAPAPTTRAIGGLLQLLLIVAAVVAFGFAVRWVISRRLVRAPSERRGPAPDESPAPPDPEALSRAAEEAAARGDYRTAVRLRYRAGLARLTDRGTIAASDTRTNREIADELAIPEFRRLSQSFARIVYGDGHAEQADDEESRTDWPAVIEKARS